MTERIGAEHYGTERVEMAPAKTERIIAEELKRRKWGEEDLAEQAKGGLSKVAIAARMRVRVETVVTVAWLAERLRMGTPRYLNNRLYRWRKGMLRR